MKELVIENTEKMEQVLKQAAKVLANNTNSVSYTHLDVYKRQVWSIEQSGMDTFSSTYEVDQQIKEGEQTSNVKATYTVKVHVDADGDLSLIHSWWKSTPEKTVSPSMSMCYLLAFK